MPGSHLEEEIRFGHRWWLAQREIYSDDNEHGEGFQRHMDKYHPLLQLPEDSIQLTFNIHLTG